MPIASGRNRSVRDDDREQREQRGQQAPGATQVEQSQRDPAGLPALGEEQRRDEVAADDEEHLDAEEPAGRPADLVPADEVVVEHDDGEHRDRAQAVEPGQVPQRRRTRVAPAQRRSAVHSRSADAASPLGEAREPCKCADAASPLGEAREPCGSGRSQGRGGTSPWAKPGSHVKASIRSSHPAQRGTAEDQPRMVAAGTVSSPAHCRFDPVFSDQGAERSVRPACVPVGCPWSTKRAPLTTVAR